jgi:hypothetical protein
MVPCPRLPTMPREPNQSMLRKLPSIVLIAPIIVLLVPIFMTLLIGWLIYGLSLTVLVWLVWCTRGVDTLFVYSNSPNWHDYIVESVLPRLRGRVVVLNWSERRQWRWCSLRVAVFRFFAGSKEYNPVAIVFRPFRLPRTFRFWQPFRDLKHGDEAGLRDVESRLYSYLH